MPIIIAAGVNLGVVPLLFIQVAYYKFFYPATILMAWFWLAIIVLLIPAYYGVYLYAWQLRKGENGIQPWRRAAGWLAALFFIAIGFIFANGLSLMDHVDRWEEIWLRHNVAGAALGTGSEHRRSDPLAAMALDVRSGIGHHGRLVARGYGVFPQRRRRRI